MGIRAEETAALDCELAAHAAGGHGSHPTGSERDFPWLVRERPTSTWLQIGLSLSLDRLTELYEVLASTARAVLGDTAVNFFFMHKPPGMRIRFEVTSPPAGGPVRRAVARWREDGLITDATPGVYEPEQSLFGGPVSMEHVHRLFTVDSLAWLDYHVGREREPGRSSPVNLSLAMLRGVFDDLEIVGWESRDVFDRLRRVADRRFTAPVSADPRFADTARRIRRAWAPGHDLLAGLTPFERSVVGAYRQAACAEITRWRTEYFDAEGAEVGPREAAAYFTIFHWNRSRIPVLRQTMIVEALAAGD